jgi:signal transduction histidine kinase/ligand-binding sensor domain-containing protein
MGKILHTFPGPSFFILLVTLLGACNNTNDSAFPANESEYAQPITRPFKFSEPVPLQWKVVNDNVRISTPQKINFDAISSKPFDIGVTVPLKKPMEEKTFDWSSLPDTTFDLQSFPTQKLKFKTRLLPPPTVVKANWPQAKLDASRGIMDMNIGVGFPGGGRWVLQSRSGLMWIGTSKGLCLYDGATIEIYGAEQGLEDPYIWSLYEDRENRIWIGTASGNIFILDRKAGIIQQVIDSFPRGQGYFITGDADGDIWISRADQGVLIIDLKNQTVKRFSENEGLAQNMNFYIVPDKQGLIWLTTMKGVNIIDKRAKTNRHLSTKNGLASNVVFSLYLDKTENMWIGGNGGLQKLDKKKNTMSLLSTDQGLTGYEVISCIYEDSFGRMWLSTGVGTAFAFHKDLNLLEEFKLTTAVNVYTIVEDNQQQVWLTGDNGSFKVNMSLGRPGNFNKTHGLNDQSIWSTTPTGAGQVWISSRNGIDLYDSITNSLKHIGKENGLHFRGTTYLEKKGENEIIAFSSDQAEFNVINISTKTIQYVNPELKNTRIERVLPIGEDHYLLGTGRGGLFELKGKILKQITNLLSFKDFRIHSIMKGVADEFWIGCNGGGVCVFNPSTNTLKLLTTRQGLISDNVYTTLKTKKGHILIGTRAGIDWVDPALSTKTAFTVREGLGNNEVWTLNELEETIYVGTTTGLAIMKPYPTPQELKWKTFFYGRAQGLSALDFDNNSGSFTKGGQFWAGVENQILTIIDRPNFDSIPLVTQLTGIKILDKQQRFINQTVAQEKLNHVDTLWQPDGNGFFVNKQKAFDSVWVTNTKISWDSVDQYQLPVNLVLTYDQNYLSFTFTGNDLANPDKVKYRYILEGIDKNWSPISLNSFSENYRDLPPGKYTFKVASKGMNSVWSKPATFNFTITPPWWQSWWAYLGYGLLFIGAVRTYTSYRSKTLKAQNQLLEEKVASRTSALQKSLIDLQETQRQLIHSEKMASLGELTAGIAHEIQNPLNFVNNFSEINSELLGEMNAELDKGNLTTIKAIVQNIDENEKKIVYHGKRADAIVKSMLQHSRSSSGLKEATDINALADEYLRLAYHGLRAKDKTFNATTKTDFDERIGPINIVAQDMGRVILNLITNAFYATTERKKQQPDGYEPTVTVSTKRLGDKVLISVKDNGNGIPQHVLEKIFQPFFTTKPSGQGTGLGLSLSYDIVKAHGGALEVETMEGGGTEFIITVPG